MEKRLAIYKGSVLDLGCGDGWFGGMARVRRRSLASMVRHAYWKLRRSYPAIEFLQWDLAQGLPAAAVD
ncbi:MAG: class I SAM-dependent methyltransferase [Caldilineaceae bacterium]